MAMYNVDAASSNRFTISAVIAAILIPTAGIQPLPGGAAEPKPRLVVLLTVDQLRGDMPLRFQQRFQGGLATLMQKGAVYTQAHYQHSTTFTAVGFATLATGGAAAQHGMAGNDWYDARTRRKVYCVEDQQHQVLGDPESQGASPRNLTCSTFGDEWIDATSGKGRVFSVSIKDRGAILPAGHRGKAFWFSHKVGKFVSSSYYYDQYPAWVNTFNGNRPAEQFRGEWKLLNDVETYQRGDRDDRPFEVDYKGLGRVFPHPLRQDAPADFYSALRFTPMGDEMTLNFARRLIKAESLGKGDTTDILAVGLSVTDYIGHAFGPNSLEAEDNLLRLDKSLGEFFAFLDEHVGLESVLIVLSADHGCAAAPEYSMGVGMSSGRHDMAKLMEGWNSKLKKQFKIDKNLILEFTNPSLYLNHDAIEELQLDVERVEQAVARAVLAEPGFAMAITRSALLSGRIPTDPLAAKVQRAFHPRRSGDVLIIQSPSWYLAAQPGGYAAMHGSPYPYDTYVPLMLMGTGIDPQKISRPVTPESVAPTIAAVLGIQSPNGSTGEVLHEALNAQSP